MEDASESEREVLSQNFTDVYLIFDMDPQDPIYNDDRLAKAMKHFDNSTENGKLYLNYPMLESYRHLKRPYDPEYADRSVTMDQIRRYKDIVGEESYDDIKDLGKYDAETFLMIVCMNVIKGNIMLNGHRNIPTPAEYESWKMTKILDSQISMLGSCNRIMVINTSVFYVVDFNPEMFLEAMSHHHRCVANQLVLSESTQRLRPDSLKNHHDSRSRS